MSACISRFQKTFWAYEGPIDLAGCLLVHTGLGLGVRDALYFDGSISRLYAPSVNRADFGRSMGPIIGLVE